MSSRRDRSREPSRESINLTRREQIILRNHDRARRRRQVRDGIGRESVETAERAPRTEREDFRFDPNRSLHERTRIAQYQRPELIVRRPKRRHTDNTHFREPMVSHRIVGRDVDVNEDRMFERLPAPDLELHMRTWRSLNRVYPKASIVEMVRGLDREKFMEFARIIVIGLPVASIVDMRRRGMIEDIQRVTGLEIVDDSHQGCEYESNQNYNDDGYDKSDLEDELVFDPDSDEIEVPSVVKRHPYSKISPAADISSDEPMDDYVSTDNDNNSLRGRSMPKSVKDLRINLGSRPSHVKRSRLEPLRQSDEDEERLLPENSVRPVLPSISVVPLALLSKPNPRSSNNISADKAGKFHEAEICRFQECIAAAYSTLDGRRAKVKNDVLDKFVGKASLLVKLFEYETMLNGVFDIMQSSNRRIPSVRNYEPRLDADIPLDIYRVVEQTDYKVESTAQSRLHEAHNFLDLNRILDAEILRRSPLCPAAHVNRENLLVASIKFDMACVVTKRSRQALEATQVTEPELFKTAITRATTVRQNGMRVSAYTNSMGSSAALLIWPWLDILAITRSPLHRLQHVFIDGVSRFIKGFNEFPATQALINHLSTWFEGWMAGSISSKMAKERLEAFLTSCGNGGPLRKEPMGAQLSCSTSTHDEPGNELQQLIKRFAAIPRADNATYSTVGTAGYDMSLNVSDMESLGSQRQLTERAIEAVLATTKFPEGVMFARASGYGSLYDQREYEHERSMPIDQGVKTILCPVHTGKSTRHWVGVVVRLDYSKRKKLLRPGITMILLDSMAADTNSAIYDERVIRNIVVTWLRYRLPGFGSGFDGGLSRPRVEQQEDLNSCGVHMLLNLRAAGLDGKYISKGGNCNNKEWIDNARESFVKRILRSAGKHLGGDIERTMNELLDEPGQESREPGTNRASAGRALSPRLGS